jgi:hypothetical protein
MIQAASPASRSTTAGGIEAQYRLQYGNSLKIKTSEIL